MGRFERCISTSHDHNTHSAITTITLVVVSRHGEASHDNNTHFATITITLAVVSSQGEGCRQVGRLDKHSSQGEEWRQVVMLDKHYLSPYSETLTFGSVFSIGISK